MIKLPTLVEKYPGFSAYGYGATNEESQLIRELLKGRRFKRAGGICSAGEIPLFVLLNFAKEVCVIDHSYRSLRAAYSKAIMLSVFGPRRTKEILTAPNVDNSIHQMVDVLMAPVITNWCKDKEANKIISASTNVNWIGYNAPDWIGYNAPDLRKEWHFAHLSWLTKAASRLDRLSMAHGDLTELEGSFDLLYLSNAHEHQGRNGLAPDLKKLSEKLQKNGIIVLVHTGTRLGASVPASWQLIKTTQGIRTSWTYKLYKYLGEPSGPSNTSSTSNT